MDCYNHADKCQSRKGSKGRQQRLFRCLFVIIIPTLIKHVRMCVKLEEQVGQVAAGRCAVHMRGSWDAGIKAWMKSELSWMYQPYEQHNSSSPGHECLHLWSQVFNKYSSCWWYSNTNWSQQQQRPAGDVASSIKCLHLVVHASKKEAAA